MLRGTQKDETFTSLRYYIQLSRVPRAERSPKREVRESRMNARARVLDPRSVVKQNERIQGADDFSSSTKERSTMSAQWTYGQEASLHVGNSTADSHLISVSD